jgi:hypothetical protein
MRARYGARICVAIFDEASQRREEDTFALGQKQFNSAYQAADCHVFVIIRLPVRATSLAGLFFIDIGPIFGYGTKNLAHLGAFRFPFSLLVANK